MAGLPPELALELVALKMFLQYHQFPLSGSKPIHLSQAPCLSSTYAMPLCAGSLSHICSRLYDLLSTVVETFALSVTISRLNISCSRSPFSRFLVCFHIFYHYPWAALESSLGFRASSPYPMLCPCFRFWCWCCFNLFAPVTTLYEI